VAATSGSGAAARTQGWRKDVRGLGAGDHPVYDAGTGEPWPASLFVSVLGTSSYTYADPTRDQQLEAWIQAHIHAREFFGGVPTLAVPDNAKTAVTPACRYDPDLNPTYQDFAVHYGMGVVPARPYKPRDGQSRKRSASLRALDRGRAAVPEALQPGGTQPGDP
jgi:transposase